VGMSETEESVYRSNPPYPPDFFLNY
jgi:hypothetical protein